MHHLQIVIVVIAQIGQTMIIYNDVSYQLLLSVFLKMADYQLYN